MPILSLEERVGTKVAGKYALRKILGRGGMGAVFLAVNEWTDREVALKLLKPELSQSPEIVLRFLAEARSAARIKHPNVVDVLDMGQDPADEAVFIILELLEGETLGDRLKREGAIAPFEVVALLEPVMDALAMAHEQHLVVHRDIKPDNIFLVGDPRQGIVPKLLDFGIAKVADDAQAAETKTGSMIGTPWYMSPEQVMGDKGLSTPSDVWSFGVMLYEAVSRRRPFPAPNANAAMVMIARDDPRPLHLAAPHLSPQLCQVIDGALRREPSERPTMRAFAAQLKAAVALTDTDGITLRAHLGGVRITGAYRHPGSQSGWASQPNLPAAVAPDEGAPDEGSWDIATPTPDEVAAAPTVDTELPFLAPSPADVTAPVALPPEPPDPSFDQTTETPLGVDGRVEPSREGERRPWPFLVAAAALLVAGLGGIGYGAFALLEGEETAETSPGAPPVAAAPSAEASRALEGLPSPEPGAQDAPAAAVDTAQGGSAEDAGAALAGAQEEPSPSGPASSGPASPAPSASTAHRARPARAQPSSGSRRGRRTGGWLVGP